AVPKPPRVRENQDPFAPGSTYRSYWRKYAQREAEAMRRGGVCLFEGWQEGILDERMVRAFFSGCVVATVIPEVEHRSISSFLLPLSPSETDGLLLPSTQLSDHLANLSAADLERKATGAFAEAWKLFTPKVRLNNVLELVRVYQEGGRGYMFPHRFRWSCASKPRPPWCTEIASEIDMHT
ncbi:hypothetical protein TREMEDRAFT_56071, partial [Tremella mesenterica DSM 1558]|uniref:uncharacterized protein n=1 Tax=Tremella mesenterica (strain ATCC 24925 / CBS 8224 / DSM 1558 / NBRC 9311 / NRRL Y-6157 / RJB 2259-6 / UBC 559-6) TaxID=578456 RepID=UPI0003F48E03